MEHHSRKMLFSDLAIVNCPTNENNLNDLRNINTGNELFEVMTCGRQLWMGEKGDFDSLPEEFRNRHVVVGETAYKSLLQYLTGMSGKTDGESHVVSQVKQFWRSFCEKNPEKAGYMQNIWESLLADSAMLRTNVIPICNQYIDTIY